jgi:hypothetical protein
MTDNAGLELLMSRPTSSDPAGKRNFEIKLYCTEAMYDDLVAFAHVARKTKSEMAASLLHCAMYGLYGLGAELSPKAETDGRPTNRPESDR